MKFAFAFVLIALFAVIAISQARPHPDQTAASSDDGTSVNTKTDIEKDTITVEADGRRFKLKTLKNGIGSASGVVSIVCSFVRCIN